MPYAIAVFFEDEFEQYIYDIWKELGDQLSLQPMHKTPVPHLSLHVAESYNIELLDDYLRPILRQFDPFDVTVGGLGIFTGAQPGIHLNVRVTEKLHDLHAAVWEALTEISTGTNPNFHPDNWIPHIGVFPGKLDVDAIADATKLLTTRDFKRKITIDEIGLLGSDEGEMKGYTTQFRLSG